MKIEKPGEGRPLLGPAKKVVYYNINYNSVKNSVIEWFLYTQVLIGHLAKGNSTLNSSKVINRVNRFCQKYLCTICVLEGGELVIT